MRQSELLRRIARAAKDAKVVFVFVRHGGKHDIYTYAGRIVYIPRHNDVHEGTAQGILRDLDIR